MKSVARKRKRNATATVMPSVFSPSSSERPRILLAAAMDLIASFVAGSEKRMPMSAPPSSSPIPSGRLNALKP